jgi:hypothetical protein
MRKNIPNLFVILAILLASLSPVFASAVEAQASNPDLVNIPGTHQDELGCPGRMAAGLRSHPADLRHRR